jgi:hypothetical protein
VRTPKHVALMPDNALAASGHATTAPPSAASNSRRPMVTVIRPSRARCVMATIPRHERAVFTFKEGRMACFVGLMRGEILPDRCNQCQPPVGTSMSTDSEIDLDRDRLRHRYRAPHLFPGAIEEARGVGGF